MNAREWSLRIADLARREHCALVDLLLALAEFDRLAVCRQLGFASLFDFLHGEVGLSRGSAYYRQVAARLVGQFPEVAEPLRDGRLCISNVVQLAKVMTDENRAEVMPQFFHCAKEEAKQVVAPREPAPVDAHPVARDLIQPEGARPVLEVRRTVVEPLTGQESRMHITVSPAFLTLLKKARAGQGHVQPGATDEQVLTAALELLIEKQEKRKASVPAKVKREVKERDRGECQWPLASGGMCGSVVRVEIDHVVPRGRGGPSTVENCRILCKPHNLEAARQVYGDDWMDRFARGAGRDVPPGEPVAREAESPA
jgi:hypothetical protein